MRERERDRETERERERDRERGRNGWVADHFDCTHYISMYLLAMIVCDFNYVENFMDNTGVAVNIQH